MSLREEQCKKVCRILDDALANRPTERDSLIVAVRKAFAEAFAEPKKGKWIRDGHHIRCDQCGMYMCDTDREGDRIPTEFCPNCGADMREVTI